MTSLGKLRRLVGLEHKHAELVAECRDMLADELAGRVAGYEAWFRENTQWPEQAPPPFVDGYLDSFIGAAYDDSFFSVQYHQAAFWRKHGVAPGTASGSLSHLRDLFLGIGNNLRDPELVRALCRVVDFSQSIQAMVHHFGQLLEQHQQQAEQAMERAQRTYRNLARSEKEGIFSAYIGHLRWKLEAYRLALGAPVDEVELPVSTHACVLGRWLDGGGLRQIPEEQRDPMNAAHERLHSFVERMVADAGRGHPEEIAYYLGDLETASDEITFILDMCLADRVSQMATEDTLTRLPNRRQFNLDCEHKLSYVSRTGTPLSLLLIDIDHFKSVNDTYGHAIGDELLQQIADRLKSAIRAADRVYRWGGEEFAVLAWPSDMKELEQVAERICLEIAVEPFETTAASIDITASIGGALYDNVQHHTMEVLFQHADANLNRAKEGGRNRVVLDGTACIIK